MADLETQTGTPAMEEAQPPAQAAAAAPEAAPEALAAAPAEAPAAATPAADAPAAAAPPAQAQAPAAPAQPAPAAPVSAPASTTDSEDAAHAARARLLQIARVDSDNAARLAAQNADFSRRGELLIKAVPERYLQLIAELRTSVRAFNSALVSAPGNIIPHITWTETPNVALRDPYSGDGMRVRIGRTHSHFELVLRFASRPGKVDVPLIEGFGSFGREVQKRKVLMRIEGWIEGGKLTYWYNLDFKRLPIDLAELPDRIVMAVASHDYSLLSRDLRVSQLATDEIGNPGDSTDSN